MPRIAVIGFVAVPGSAGFRRPIFVFSKKTVVYWSVVFVLRLLEHLIEYGAGGGKLGGLQDYRAAHYPWTQFAAVQIWIFTLFLIYTTAAELNALFGEGEIRKILFASGSSQRKATMRQRIRTLLKLTRLTEAHTLNELRDPHTLIGGLAMDQAGRGAPETLDTGSKVITR